MSHTRLMPFQLEPMSAGQLAAVSWLARYSGHTHTLYAYQLQRWFGWCEANGLDPLVGIRRAHIELYIRHLGEAGLMASSMNPRSTPRCTPFGDSSGSPTSTDGSRATPPSTPASARATSRPPCRSRRPVLRVLEACRGERTETPLILRPLSGKPTDRRDVYRMVVRIARTAGIPRHFSPHSLRHAAITNALDAGVPLRDAQILARHADPRTTEHYDRARGNLDRHGVHFLTAYVAGVRRIAECGRCHK